LGRDAEQRERLAHDSEETRPGWSGSPGVLRGFIRHRREAPETSPPLAEACASPPSTFAALPMDYRAVSLARGAPPLRTGAGLELIAANRDVIAVDLNLRRRATRRGSGRDGVGRSDSRQGENQENELLAHDSPPSRETGLPATGRPLSSPYPTPVAFAPVQRETGRHRSSSC